MAITSPVPPNLLVPLFWASVDNSLAGVPTNTQLPLLIGQVTNAIAATGVPTYVPSVQFAQNTFGKNSMLAAMCAAYIANDPFTPLWVVPIADNAAGAAATGSIAFSGTATAAGTLNIYIAGQLVQWAVNVGDTAAMIATNGAAAANALGTLPATVTAATGTITVTAVHKGAVAGNWPIVVNALGTAGGQVTPAGISVTVTAMSGGTGDPTLSTLATALGSSPFDFIVNPYQTQMSATTALLSDQSGRWSWLQQIYGGAFCFHSDTLSNLVGLTPANDQHSTLFCASGTSSPDYVMAAACLGAMVPWVQKQPNLPLKDRPINGIVPPASAANKYTKSQLQQLLSVGLSPIVWDAFGQARFTRVITTYVTDAAGVPDQSYLDVGVPYTLMAIIRACRSAVLQQFNNALLVDNGTKLAPGISAVSPNGYKAFLAGIYDGLENQGLVQSADAMIKATIVQLSTTVPGRLEVVWAPYLVPGLEIIDQVVQFRLLPPAA